MVSTHHQRGRNTSTECFFVLCERKVLRLLVEELTDKIDAARQRKEATGQISLLLYGETLSAKKGFLLLCWRRKEASTEFRNMITRFLDDEDIVDHLSVPLSLFDLDVDAAGFGTSLHGTE